MTDMKTRAPISASADDPFDLDIRALEAGDEAQPLILVTDDNCGSTCPNACASGPKIGETEPADTRPVR